MTRTLTLLDRLRIERLVWTLDQYLYDLPWSSRVGKRREVRANLMTAAQEVGTTTALRRLGGSRRLAEEYLRAEFGDGPRHSWIAAFYFAGAVPLVLNFFLSEAAAGFEQGVTATAPDATGTFTWQGISYLQSSLTYTFNHGQSTHTGGAWTPLTYVLLLSGMVACGRLWRLLPRRRRD
ncbi:hypothetical protein GCM10027589_36190 [Actinocorallia lasiicapitis]